MATSTVGGIPASVAVFEGAEPQMNKEENEQKKETTTAAPKGNSVLAEFDNYVFVALR